MIDYGYLTAIQNCGFWFVIHVYKDGTQNHCATFFYYEDAEWYGMSQAL